MIKIYRGNQVSPYWLASFSSSSLSKKKEIRRKRDFSMTPKFLYISKVRVYIDSCEVFFMCYLLGNFFFHSSRPFLLKCVWQVSFNRVHIYDDSEYSRSCLFIASFLIWFLNVVGNVSLMEKFGEKGIVQLDSILFVLNVAKRVFVSVLLIQTSCSFFRSPRGKLTRRMLIVLYCALVCWLSYHHHH